MPNLGRAFKALPLLWQYDALVGIFTWPIFSISSFTLVSACKRLGVRPRTVIDVGANEGQFACASAGLFSLASIHCFEPHPVLAAKLRENARQLKIAQIHEVAIGAKMGSATLNINSHPHSSSLLRLGAAHLSAFPNATETSRLEVRLSTLDNELRNLELERPILLKLDVQGFEKEVIRGAEELLSDVDYILAETSFVPLYEREPPFMELAREIEAHGFRFNRPAGWLAHPHTQDLLQIDALFLRDAIS